MSVFIAISILLALIVAKSGGAIRPVVTFTPNWGNILQGDPVTLTCDVTSTIPEEPRSYQWYKDNNPMAGQQSLVIRSSRVDYSGDYQCRISGGDISDPVTLHVTNSFLILQRPPSDIYEGDPLTLRCHHISGYAEQPTTFYKDNQEIKSGLFDEFHVDKVDLNMAGDYKCTKKINHPENSTYHEFSDELSLSVKELFSVPEVKTPDLIEGDYMALRCDTRLDPCRANTELQFAFYRDRRPVQEFSVSDKYRVRSAQTTDSGYYTCEVRTATDTVRKRSDGFYIQIQEIFLPPKINMNLNVKEGDNMTVSCDTRLHPDRGGTELQFAFYRDGQTIQEFSVSDKYRMRSAQMTDSGNYTCEVRTATDTVRKMSDELNIQIQEIFPPPKINMNLTVKEGDEMTVSCDTRLHSDRRGTKLQFAFYKDRRTVQEFNVSDIYRVWSAQPGDSGYYICEVRTATDTVRKRSDWLYIQIQELFSTPKIKVTPNRVIEGGDMTVRCDTRVDPNRISTELQFAFYRDGRTIQEFRVSDKYRVRSSQMEDSGKYTCEVRTATDTVRKMSDELYIQIQELFPPPKINKNISITEGDDMTVRCDTRLHPDRRGTKLQFAFYRDGWTVQEFSVSNKYRVWSSQMEDSGNYTCEVRTATDTVIKISDGLYIQIQELFPPPKINMKLMITEGDNMTVRCDTRLHPDRRGTKLQFAFYKDGRTVQKFNVSDKYRVRSAQPGDSGDYTCEVRTMTDTVKKKSAGLYIQIHELFSTPKVNVTPNPVIEGGDMTVVCDTRVNLNRNSTELQFAFYRDGRTIQEFNVSHTYRVRSARMADAGNYTCEVNMGSKKMQKMSNGFYLQIIQGKCWMSPPETPDFLKGQLILGSPSPPAIKVPPRFSLPETSLEPN